ncbi:hypothetical protein Cgig2_004813 [Carnegiea gigantea]|uniref:Basic blue protein n=1 Tax=Carnegiea gigantea TaxID=171969 RepID=A0A9Q1KSY5_9CARY|nr:hypothetical protein Cgig2_004813 [Carnegiea gigantea]
MAKGRGSATRPCLVVGVAIICTLALSEPALGAIYTVGGAAGWTLNVNSWSSGKSFNAGDVLAFNYDKTIHNVVQVDKKGYDNCSSPKGAKVYQTGKDRIKLKSGHNYFICTTTGRLCPLPAGTGHPTPRRLYRRSRLSPPVSSGSHLLPPTLLFVVSMVVW